MTALLRIPWSTAAVSLDRKNGAGHFDALQEFATMTPLLHTLWTLERKKEMNKCTVNTFIRNKNSELQNALNLISKAIFKQIPRLHLFNLHYNCLYSHLIEFKMLHLICKTLLICKNTPRNHLCLWKRQHAVNFISIYTANL